MQLSTLDYIRLVAPSFPPRLISETTASWCHDVAGRLPPSSNIIFECRLAEPEPKADFLVAVLPSDGSLGAWTGSNSLSVLPDVPSSEPTWSKILSFLRAWEGGDERLSPLYDVWLEFDQSHGLPEPSFFFGYNDALGLNHPELTAELIADLQAAPLPDARLNQLRNCFLALPAYSDESDRVFRLNPIWSRSEATLSFSSVESVRFGVLRILRSGDRLY